MAATDEHLRRQIADERQHLTSAFDELRTEADVTAKLRGALPIAAAAALGAGFVLAGGIGATMRLLARRSREHPPENGYDPRARVGRFQLIRRG
jgi:hypothetical protein